MSEQNWRVTYGTLPHGDTEWMETPRYFSTPSDAVNAVALFQTQSPNYSDIAERWIMEVRDEDGEWQFDRSWER